MFQVNVMPLGGYFRVTYAILFLLDALIVLNTGIYDKGKLILKRSVIAKGYLDGNAITDIISIVSLAFA